MRARVTFLALAAFASAVARASEPVVDCVEVKTRSEGLTIDPILAVDETKMRNLAIAANAYVKQMGIDADVRFDIITVVGMDSRHCDVIHTEDAFNPLLLSR